MLVARAGTIVLGPCGRWIGCAIQNAPLVFVGYGVHAPERGWDDFKGCRPEGQDRRLPDQRSRLRGEPGEPVVRQVRRQGRDLLRPLDLQVRGGGAPRRDRRPDRPRDARRRLRLVDGDRPQRADLRHRPTRSGEGRSPPARRAGSSATSPPTCSAARASTSRRQKRAARRTDFLPSPCAGAAFSADYAVASHGSREPQRDRQAHGDAAAGRDGDLRRPLGRLGVGRARRAGRPHPPWRGRRRPRRGRRAGAGARLRPPAPAAAHRSSSRSGPPRSGACWDRNTYAVHPIYAPAPRPWRNLTMDTLETVGPSHDVVLVGAGQNQPRGHCWPGRRRPRTGRSPPTPIPRAACSTAPTISPSPSAACRPCS